MGNASVNCRVPNQVKGCYCVPQRLIQEALIFAPHKSTQSFYGCLPGQPFSSLPLSQRLKELFLWVPGNKDVGWGCWAGELGVEALKAKRAALIQAQLEKTQTGWAVGQSKAFFIDPCT